MATRTIKPDSGNQHSKRQRGDGSMITSPGSASASRSTSSSALGRQTRVAVSGDKDMPRSGVNAYRLGEVMLARSSGGTLTMYKPGKGVDAYVRAVATATPLETVEIERRGVQGIFIKDLSKRMGVPASRMFAILGVPKATAEKKAAAGEMVGGRGGQAAVGMVKLLGIAHDLVRDSTAAEAKGFDAAKWLGQWIERPQPALGGHKPADLIDTPTGVAIVARLLSSIESGAYQ